MYSTLRAGHIALSILLLIFLSSCSDAPPQPLRLGTNVWPGYEPLHLARELNYFGDHPIHLVEHSAATEVIRAMRNGAIDAAALTLDETLLLTQHGHRLWILLITDFSHAGDAVDCTPRPTESFRITREEDWPGRRAG